MAGHTKILSPRQIAFALAVVSGKTYLEAARIAGYKAGNDKAMSTTAGQTARLPIVAAEIKRLRDEAAAVTELTAEWWRPELAYQYNRIRDSKDADAALRALEIAGRHLGLFDRRGDDDAAEKAARLTANLAALMSVQLLAQQNASPELRRTVEAEVREILETPARDDPQALPDQAASPTEG